MIGTNVFANKAILVQGFSLLLPVAFAYHSMKQSRGKSATGLHFFLTNLGWLELKLRNVDYVHKSSNEPDQMSSLTCPKETSVVDASCLLHLVMFSQRPILVGFSKER